MLKNILMKVKRTSDKTWAFHGCFMGWCSEDLNVDLYLA